MRKGDQRPERQDDAIIRSKDTLLLWDGEVIAAAPATKYTDGVECAPFGHFALLLAVDSTGSPTTIRFEVQFLNRWDQKWYTWKQGMFASLYYEYVDTASGIQEAFSGDCVGRDIRIKATVAGGSSSAYFTVSISLELWD